MAFSEKENGKQHDQSRGQNVYVLRTHTWNDSLTEMFTSLKESFGQENVWILLDSTNYDYKTHLADDIKIDSHLVVLDDALCRKMSLLHKTCYQTPETSFVYIYQIISKSTALLKFMWVIEYDVRCTGKWHDCLGPINQNYDHDFLATRVEPFTKENHTWHWWGPAADWRKLIQVSAADDQNEEKKILMIDARKRPPLEQCAKSFLPISRYSRRYLDVMTSRLGRISAYCEVFLPSLCLQSGFKIGNLPLEITNHEHFRYGEPIITPTDVPINEVKPRLFHPVRQ